MPTCFFCNAAGTFKTFYEMSSLRRGNYNGEFITYHLRCFPCARCGKGENIVDDDCGTFIPIGVDGEMVCNGCAV